MPSQLFHPCHVRIVCSLAQLGFLGVDGTTYTSLSVCLSSDFGLAIRTIYATISNTSGRHIDKMTTMTHLLVLLVAVVVLASTEPIPADNNPHCIKNSRTCVRNDECCGGCCGEGKCVAYAESCIQGQSPCSNHPCAPGQSCYLQQVNCIQAPCPPIPACKSKDYDEDY